MDTSTGRLLRAAVVLAVFVALPAHAMAQAAPAGSTSPRAGAIGAFLVTSGEVAEARAVFMGGWGGLVFREGIVLGGGGVALTKRIQLAGAESSTGFDLGAGFGGIYLRYIERTNHRLTPEGGLFLGAGHAEVTDRMVGLEIGADNFFVIEPEAALGYRVFRRLHVGVSLGYRFVWGVQDLPLLASGDFRSLTGSVSLRLGGP
jgi:hypothetical protein